MTGTQSSNSAANLVKPTGVRRCATFIDQEQPLEDPQSPHT
jgi:hypothetical protein